MITHLFGQGFFLRLEMRSAKIYLRKEVPIEEKPLDCPMLIKQWGEWIFKHWTVFKTLIGWWLVWGLWLLYYPLDIGEYYIILQSLTSMNWEQWGGHYDSRVVCHSPMFIGILVRTSLVGGLEHFFIFHNIWDNPSHWLIFFRGVETTNQINIVALIVIFVA